MISAESTWPLFSVTCYMTLPRLHFTSYITTRPTRPTMAQDPRDLAHSINIPSNLPVADNLQGSGKKNLISYKQAAIVSNPFVLVFKPH